MFIGDRLKKIRLEKSLSQTELGKLIDVSKVSISGYENGTKLPTVDRLIKLCEHLNVTPNYLLGFDMLISEPTEEYNIHLATPELELIKELRKKNTLYKKIMAEPKRTVEIIDRNIIN